MGQSLLVGQCLKREAPFGFCLINQMATWNHPGGLVLVCLAACEQDWTVTHIMGNLQISHVSASYDFLREYFCRLRKGFLWETCFFLGNAVSQSCHCKLQFIHPMQFKPASFIVPSVWWVKKKGEGDNPLLSSPPFIFSSSRKFSILLHWYFFLLMFTFIFPATVTIVSILIPSLTWSFTFKRLKFSSFKPVSLFPCAFSKQRQLLLKLYSYQHLHIYVRNQFHSFCASSHL